MKNYESKSKEVEMNEMKDVQEENSDSQSINREEEISNNEQISEDVESSSDEIAKEDQSAELIKNLTQELDFAKDKLLRSVAEVENTRNRMNKKVEEAKDYAVVNFVKDLLPLVDDFSRILLHAPKNLDNETKIIVEGINMTQNSLMSVFKKYGIESINPAEGDDFDYNNHHAISQVVTEQHKKGSIVSTMQVGYKIKDRLIRPASVSVAKE